MTSRRLPTPPDRIPATSVASLEPLIALTARLQEEVGVFLHDRRQWERERELFRAMIDQVPDYVFAKDAECRFIVANRAVAADLGHGNPDELLGKTDLDLHPPELAEGFMRNDRAVIRTGKARLNVEEYVIMPGGDRKWLSTSKSPLLDQAGKVIGLVGISRDISDHKRSEEHLRFLAFHDPLTRLPNRIFFEKEVRKVVGALKDEAYAALFYLDLDGFKQINDSLGHEAGDEVIRKVAKRLSDFVGLNGLVARLGGDEFALLLQQPYDPEAALAAAGDLLDTLERHLDVFGNTVEVGGSIGIASLTPGADVQTAMRQADIALYAAKARGGNIPLVFEEAMAATLRNRLAIERDLRAALRAKDQLHLCYQPVYAADARTLVGAEALVRWRHPRDGLLGPDTFIQVAEQSGLIEELGNWVLQTACEDVKTTACPWVAVNVSPVQMRNQGLAATILKTLADCDVPPSRLQIEVTEGVLLENPDQAAATLQQLRDAGIKVALDDFGTGYSSLSYLQRYNVDKLKVDRSFVEKLGTSKGADAIVRSIVSLGRALDMRVTAEGVETREQCDHLAGIGCQELQGFLLGRPMGIADLQALLDHTNKAIRLARADPPRSGGGPLDGAIQ